MTAGRLLVVEKSACALGIVDLVSGARVAGVPLSGVAPHEVAATADGAHAMVPIYGDSVVGAPGTDGRTVDLVDLRALEVRTVDLGAAGRPHDVALGPDGRFYVTAEVGRAVLVLDRDGRLARTLPTGHDQAHMIAVSRTGRRAYTADVEPGGVSVIDLETGGLVTVLELGERVNRISISPDDRHLYVADQRAARLAVVATADFDVRWIELPSVGYATAPIADGTRLVVGFRGTSQVGILDLATGETVLVDVPPTPQRIVVPPGTGEFAYVTCDRSDVVVEIDLGAGAVRRTFDVGAGPDGLAWAPNPGIPAGT